MKAHWKYLSNRCGISTVELVIILAALVSVAIMFKGSLSDFTHRTAAAEFNKKGAAEIMTFGGEIKAARGRNAVVSGAPEKNAGLRDVIDRLIASPLRGLLSAGRAMPVTAPVRNGAANRNPGSLNAVLDQFAVETTNRYQPSLFSTYCNIFVWDVTRAMNAEIPHWISRKDKTPYMYNSLLSYSRNAELAFELNVNMLYEWMETHAGAIGYREVSEQEARAAANIGQPAVALWKNPKEGGSGHIVVLRPCDPSRAGDPGVTYIAQAGRQTVNYSALEKIFSPSQLKALKFYVHD